MKFRFDNASQLLRRATFAALAVGLTSGFNTVLAADPPVRVSPIVRAIQRAEAAVVNIQGNKSIAVASAGGAGSKQEVNGMGTGVIIDPRGYIVTNLHVVEDVNRIEVTLADGSTAIAKLLNYDPETDLALIKIPTSKDLPTIQFGTSSDLMRGETVIAIGNPFGYQNTVTQGIISALHRNIPVNGTQEYKNLIQTNADINPGNSGGPLLNLDGEVIGINVAVRVGAQGIGFAIPIDSALEVMADLVAASHREPVAHGLDLTRSYENGVSKLMIRGEGGEETSRRDLRTCDIVESVQGVAVTNRLELELALLDHGPGDPVEITLARGEERIRQSLALRPSGYGVTEQNVARVAWEQLGVRVVPVPATAVSGFNDEYTGGLKITEIRAGSPAARQRLMPGDVIVGIMDWHTATMENLQWVLSSPSFRTAPTSKYYVIRKRQQMMVAMSPESTRNR
ncbi:MAG: trypsin-like peptidase domain-containing protein [Pirellula sp.]